jgi:hypothetical protein
MNIFSNVHILTWFGVILMLIGTIFTFWGQQIISNKSNKEISNKQEQILNLSTKNADLSNEITKLVTGGDSFCYLLPFPDQMNDRQGFMVFHEGKYPLYDVVIEIEYRFLLEKLPLKKLYDEIAESQKKDVAEGRPKKRDLFEVIDVIQNKAIKRYQIGTVFPSIGVNLERIPIPAVNEMNFFIKIYSRNGYFTQNISEKKIGNIWRSSWRVMKNEVNGEFKIIKEQINAEVPLKD